MSNNPITLADLSAADRLALFEQMRALEALAREQRKAQREARRVWMTDLVTLVAAEYPDQQTFASGAVGWSMGGKDIVIPMEDGTKRKARVSLLIRWEDTIPAKGADNDGKDADKD